MFAFELMLNSGIFAKRTEGSHVCNIESEYDSDPEWSTPSESVSVLAAEDSFLEVKYDSLSVSELFTILIFTFKLYTFGK